jgi:hypothetical protein
MLVYSMMQRGQSQASEEREFSLASGLPRTESERLICVAGFTSGKGEVPSARESQGDFSG